MRLDHLPALARRLTDGEVVRVGDLQAIGDGFYEVRPCRYDQAGRVCCVGRRIEGHERYYRVPGTERRRRAREGM